MKHINKILLCAHPKIMNVNLADHAADIAKKSHAEIKVFSVISGFPQDMKEWWNVRNPQELHDKIQSERESFLVAVADLLKERGIEKVTYELRWGKEFMEITREVMRNAHDLVMVTARDRTELGKRLFECPSRDLFLTCPCSLWITKYGNILKQTKRVVAAISGEGGRIDLCHDALNAKILNNAAAVAEANNSELHIVHVLPKYGRKGIKKGRDLRPDLTEFVDELRNKLTTDCGVLLEDYDLTMDKRHVHLLIGDPSEVIPEFVNDLGVDLIVMGTVARTGIPGVVYGNTAEKVLDHAISAILAVKPDDFVSPITINKEHEKA